MKKISQAEISDLAGKYGFEYAAVKAVIMVEGSGNGYDSATGKILIQFEPHWYKKIDAQDGYSGGGIWEANKVETQPGEWKAFNDAFSKDADAAMQGTSWGMMQVMGFHYKTLGFDSVGELVDFAKESEANQVELGFKFILTNKKMAEALRKKDWATFAYYYNGSGYKKFRYDERLAAAYNEPVS